MTNAEKIWSDFWIVFDGILIENGEPFKIIHEMSGKVKSWGTINSYKLWKSAMVCVGLRTQKKEVGIDIYVEDRNTEIGRIILANKDEINRLFPMPVQWLDGEKQSNTFRIRYTLSFADCTYREVIEKALPIIMEFIFVAKKYGEKYFFDFTWESTFTKLEEGADTDLQFPDIKESEFIGKTVIKKSGGVYKIISAKFNVNRLLVVLDDGKIGYDLLKSIPKGFLVFEDDAFQKQVEELIKELIWGPGPGPDLFWLPIEAAKLFNAKGIKKSPYNCHSNYFSCLEANYIYGTKALDIYVKCCDLLAFDKSKKHCFNLQQILFAENATPEGYAVWMLPHSNFTGDAKAWANIIDDGGDTIYEVWRMDDNDSNSDDRITFVKQGNGEYVFMGLYTFDRLERICEVIDGVPIKFVKIYKRISKKYS